MQPFSTGTYVNVIADPGADGVDAGVPLDATRASGRAQATLDPDNVFHLNQNIRPATA